MGYLKSVVFKERLQVKESKSLIQKQAGGVNTSPRRRSRHPTKAISLVSAREVQTNHK